MKLSISHIFSNSITSVSFLLLSSFASISLATEISELEEITMQVIEADSMENIEVQQMISIPSPLSTGVVSHNLSNPEVNYQSHSKPINRSLPETKKEIPR